MQYREIIAVCSQIHNKHINTLCGQNGEVLGAFAKLRKATISTVCPSVCSYGRTRSLWTDFHEILYFRICRNSIEKNSSSMKFQQDLQALDINVDVHLITVTRTPLNVTLIRT